jgi:hypothetical protein
MITPKLDWMTRYSDICSTCATNYISNFVWHKLGECFSVEKKQRLGEKNSTQNNKTKTMESTKWTGRRDMKRWNYWRRRRDIKTNGTSRYGYEMMELLMEASREISKESLRYEMMKDCEFMKLIYKTICFSFLFINCSIILYVGYD